MSVRDLILWGRSSNQAPSLPGSGQAAPFLALHREMNRLFDQAFRGFDTPSLFGRMPSWPSVEIGETGQEVRVTAEMPGMDESGVEVLLEDGVLVLRGEKRAETQDEERQFSERFYGRFERRIPLGVEVEEDRVAASFGNGVLTVTLPKSARAQERARRIPVNAGMRH